MRFLGSKFTQNALAAGASPGTPLGELKRSPRPFSDFRGRFAAGERERGERRRRKREKGYWQGKRGGKGREGKRGGRERGRMRERGRGSFSCVIGVRGDRRPCDARRFLLSERHGQMTHGMRS